MTTLNSFINRILAVMKNVINRVRPANLSFASGPTLATLICLCMLTVGVGDVWADISLYTEGWESNHRESGTNNYTTTTKTYGSWTFYRSDAISNTGISGSYLARCRVAGSSTDSPYIVSSALTLSTDHILQVSWKCKGNTNISLTAYYSTDGSNWSVGKSATSLPSSSTSWSFNLDVTGTLYLKFVFTVASSTNSSRDGEIDDITVTGSHAAASKYTVSFETGTGNPTQANITEASGGAGITLPAGPTPTCSGDGWSFAGWKETSAVTSETTVAPTLLSAGSTFHPSGDVTLYAVYAKEGYAREKSSITSGSKYLIVANYDSKNYVMTDSYSLDGDSEGHMDSEQVDEDEDDFYLASSIDSDWRYSIEGTPSHYDIRDVKNSSSENYLDIAYKNWYGKGNDDTDEWIITVSSGNWTLQNEYYSNYLAFNTTNKVFERRSGTVWLYKQVTVYFSNPTCCTPLGTINGSVNLSHFLHFLSFSYYISISKIFLTFILVSVRGTIFLSLLTHRNY